MKNTNTKVAIINYFTNLGAKVKEVETFENALKNLELNQPYSIESKKDSFKFVMESEDYLKIVRLHHPEIIEHDAEEMTNEESESWEKFTYTIGVINRCSSTDKQAILVRRIGNNDFIFYAEKAINLGYSVNAITDAYQLDDDEEPFTTEFSSSETYFNFESLENALRLEKDEMAMFNDDGEIVITEKDRELLKSEGIRATETNFTDFLDRIDKTGAAFVGYLNNHLYFC